MTVDELLVENVITPTLTYVEFHPYDIGYSRENGFLYAVGNGQEYKEKTFSILECIEKTKCGTLKTIQTNSINILIMLIRLAENIAATDNNVSRYHIMEVCNKYGFPITLKAKTENGYILGFYLDQFAKRLDNLYVNYSVWKAIQIQDYEAVSRIWPKPLSDETMRAYLKKYAEINIRLTLAYKDDKPIVLYQADDLFSLAEAQLLFLIGKGADYLNGSCISYCSDCGQPYIKARKNATLCERCKGSTGKSRRYRARMKAQEKED